MGLQRVVRAIVVSSVVVAGLGTAPAAADPPDWNEHAHRQDQILVGLEDDAPEGTLAEVEEALGGGARGLGRSVYAQSINGPVEDAIAAAEAIKGVRYAEPDYLLTTQQALTPNDLRFADMWGLNNTSSTGQSVADSDIDAPEAWNAFGTDASSVVIGVVDSGIRADHEDLAGNLWTSSLGQIGDAALFPGCVAGVHGFDAIADSCSASIDPNRHGTHVAGTIGAQGNNALGTTGVAWDVQLMSLRFLNANGSGSLSDALQTLQFAVAARTAGVNLVALNNSWGGGGFSQSMFDLITQLDALGVTFVAAAGNNGANLDTSDTFPCEYDVPNVVCVAASNNHDTRPNFSNYGATAVDLAAPGDGILSTASATTSTYQSLSGTSMATPHVTGAVALLAAQCPGQPPIVVRDALMDSVDQLPAWAGVVASGGRLNLHSLLASQAACTAVTALFNPPASLSAYGSVSATLQLYSSPTAAAVTDVTLSGLPAGVTATPGTPVLIRPGLTQLPVALTSDGAAVGTHVIGVEVTLGTDPPMQTTADVTVVPPELVLDAAPAAAIGRGATVDVPLTLSRVAGYDETAALGVTGLPEGITAAFIPDTLDASGPGTATMRLTADAQIAYGPPVTLTVTATADHASDDDVVSLQREDVVASPPGGAITIPTTRNPGSPYPSELIVGDLTTPVVSVRLHLDGLTHTWPADVAIALESPGGVTRTVMARAGGGNDVSGINLVLVDGAPALPSGQLVSGTYAPTVLGNAPVNFPSPAPTSTAGPMSSFLTVNPDDLEGTWRLWLTDLANQDGGSLGSWSLELISVPPIIAPGTPVADDAVNIGEFSLGWTASERDTTYAVDRRAFGTADPPTTVGTALTDAALAFTSAAPEDEGRWEYRVTTTRTADALTAMSGWSTEVLVDRTKPNPPNATVAPIPVVAGGMNWVPASATVDVVGAGDPDLPTGQPGSGVDPATEGMQPVAGAGPYAVTVADLAGNVSDPTVVDVVIDSIVPTVGVTGCPTGSLLQAAAASVTVAMADGESGLVTDVSGPYVLDTTTLGAFTPSWTATDQVGNTASASCSYTVVAAGGGSGGGGSSTGGGSSSSGGTPTPGPSQPEEPLEPAGDDVDRIPGTDPASVSIAVSQARFDSTGTFAAAGAGHDGTAELAVLARDDVFADALAGSSLTTSGPMLFTPAASLDPAVEAELARILTPGATVYLLGGEAALAPSVADAVAAAGWVPVRLAGPSRIETALAVADEVRALGSGADQVLIARAYGLPDTLSSAWADAISGGAYGADAGAPVVLTPTSGLHPAVASWLDANDDLAPVLLGGEAALGAGVAAALPHAPRQAGAERAGTAVAIATGLWDTEGTAYTVIDGWRDNGWAFGLAAAGLAADLDAPLLLVNDVVPAATADLLAACREAGPSLTIVGSLSVVSAALEDELRSIAPTC